MRNPLREWAILVVIEALDTRDRRRLEEREALALRKREFFDQCEVRGVKADQAHLGWRYVEAEEPLPPGHPLSPYEALRK